MQHAHATNPRIGEWLTELESAAKKLPADSDVATTVREARRDYLQRTQLPQQLVEELARTKVAAQHAWVAARKAANFTEFAPCLEKMIRLKQEEASALLPVLTPVGDQPAVLYDALLDQYEPGARVADVSVVLSNLRRDLVPLIRELLDQGKHPATKLLHREYPVAAQANLGVRWRPALVLILIVAT